MREIKFRAWIKTGGADRKGCMANLNSEEIDECIEDGEPVMQYTGLKDKNGKEIYSGDLVEYSNTIEHGLAEVKDNPGGFIFDWIKQVTSSPSVYDPAHYYQCAKELEVIGNIYETPELLD